MATGLLFGCDELVAKWLFDIYSWPDLKYNKAIGLLDPQGKLVGGVFYHNWNGSNVEVAYYGKGTMTPGIVRALAKYAITEFDASRLTAVTCKKNRSLIKGLMKIGFKLEGIQRCYYGKKDCNRNIGVRLVAFRDVLEKVAQITTKATTQCS